MYFTDTPTLNSIEAIMKKLPYGIQKGGGRFAAHTNTPRKTATADSVFTTEKRLAAPRIYVPCWTSGLDATLLPLAKR